MNEFKSFISKLKAFDLVIIVFFILLSLVNLAFLEKIPQWDQLIIINLGVISMVLIITFLENKYNSKTVNIFHYWYIAPLILLTFKELYFMIHPIRPQDFDWMFIKIDHWLFGVNPTQVLQHIAFPLLTEILQIIYGMFYLLPIMLCLFLLRNKERVVFEYAIFSIIYGFYLSYIGYFAFPGVGPRFTLHDFSMINQQLPGLWLTNYLRDFVNMGESVLPGSPNPAAIVQRDVFPSGHTMITLLVMYLSVKLKSRSRYFFIPIGTLLIFSTVYLWYHYVIDLIGGLLFMLFSVWSGKFIFNWWRRKVGRTEFFYGDIKLKDKNG
ncbi:MAG TPA: phosphatase PAP2 family protein [Ignavibacteriaceae bacterium]|nr:phosphatase PAP2 family protein [Ignavibacteriaceae bacterium]